MLEMIERVPKDRLDYLNYIVKANNIIASALNEYTARLTKPELSMYFKESDLKVIHGHFCESARCILELAQYFLDKMIEEADENPFAV